MKTGKRRKSRTFIAAIFVVLLLICGTAVYFGYNTYIKAEYPIKYENYVERYSADNNLDKFLVYAVIKTESSFNPEAVSNVGARGLMQIMQDTFDWIKMKTEDDEAEYIEMFDPQTNIKYGCYLLGYLYKEFGSVEVAMAAYHAGRGQVNEWLADSSISSDGRTLDTIPISDTAHYVAKIKKAMDTYIKLYD